MNLQKQDNNTHKKRKILEAEQEKKDSSSNPFLGYRINNEEEKEAEDLEVDELGNPIPKDEALDSGYESDSDKIKENLKNSSKTYYSITHTIQE